jgi:hypothetical protein
MIDYKGFIQDTFYIKDKRGVLMPFIFNDVQDWYYGTLKSAHPDFEGIRENLLKGRQFGLSSLIEALFCTDFIFSEQGDIPIINSDIYSHKDDETTAHINRFNLFLNSALIRSQGGGIDDMDNEKAIAHLRKAFLRVDNGGEIISRKRGAQYHAQTASAKVSGRGDTKQNMHWSEVAFYPNTEIMNAKKLVVGAEKQVPDNYGKIFRETTGNMAGDFFADEYYAGKEHKGQFTSRFIAWYQYKDYMDAAPVDWMMPEYYVVLFDAGLATRDQCYWHWRKTKGLEDKEELREYPTYDYEAFLLTGSGFFDADALIYHTGRARKPISEALYVQALV